MKKHLLLLLSLFLSTTMLFAERVSQSDAATVASNFLNGAVTSSVKKGKAATPARLTLKTAAPTASESQFYVYENPDGGWVMVSASDVVKPILAYSTTGSFKFDNQPANIKKWLGQYEDLIKKVEAEGAETSEEVKAEWTAVRSGLKTLKKTSVVVDALCKTIWDQGTPFNDQCPKYNGTDMAITGCVATAMAQIMKYWEWPVTGTGSHSYHPKDRTSGEPSAYIENLTANFGETNYDWANMRNAYYSGKYTEEEGAAVAQLMYHCGVAVEMMYGASSGSLTVAGETDPSAENAFKTYFGYNSSTVKGYFRNDYTDANWIKMMKTELDNGRPILYGGGSEDGSGGHAFVCDGYDSDNFFHFNFGWSGSGDGFYLISSITPGYDLSYDQDMIVGIQPYKSTTAVVPIKWSIEGQVLTYYENQGSAVSFGSTPGAVNGKTFIGWTADPDHPENYFSLASTKVVALEPATYYAVFAKVSDAGAGSATYEFTGEDWTATLNGNAANWISGSKGANFQNGGVKIKWANSGAYATCPDSYGEITSIVVNYCTNVGKGAGKISMIVGGQLVEDDVTNTEGTTPRDMTLDFSNTKPDGAPKIVGTCSEDAFYIRKVTINYNHRYSYSGLTLEPGKFITIRYKDTQNWDNVYLWAWTDEGNIFNEWPGQKLDKDEDGLYSYSFEDGISDINVIFSNGKSGTDAVQTGNLESVLTASTCLQFNGANEPAAVVDCNELIPDLYILGAVEGNNYAWGPHKGTKMDYAAGEYTLTTHVAAGAGSYEPGFLSFTTKLAATDDWAQLSNFDRWAADEEDKVVADGQTYNLSQENVNNAFKFKAGTWKITVSLINKTMSVELISEDVEPQKFTVTWITNGIENPVTAYENSPLELPAAPSACANGKVFVGWTEATSVNADAAPADLFTEAGDKTVTGNLTYHAVFATATESVGSETDVTLWSEDFSDFAADDVPTEPGSSTVVYGSANVTYMCMDGKSATKIYNDALAQGTAPELLVSKTNGTFTISGIPTAGARSMSLSFKANKTTISVSTSTGDLTVSGSGTAWTLTVADGQDSPETFDITIENTGSQNARIDDIAITCKMSMASVSYSDFSLGCGTVTPLSTEWTITLVDVPEGWGSTINLYAWDNELNPLNGDWPGTAMTANRGTTYTATLTVYGSNPVANIIFNDGTNQTVDIEGITGSGRFRVNDAAIAGKNTANEVYKVSLADVTNGEISGLNTWYAAGDEVSFTATPDENYSLSSVTVKEDESGNAVSVSENKFTMPAADVTLAAVFAKEAAKVTVTWNDRGTETPVEFNEGDALVLPANPAACANGKVFVGWTTSHAVDGSAPADLFKEAGDKTVDADITYYAVFATETTSGSGSGTPVTLTMSDYEAVSGSIGDFTFTAGGSGTQAAYNGTGKDARYYAGNTLTISSASAMTEIVFILSSQGKKRLAPITASDGVISDQASGDETVTWTGSATEVTFTVGAKANYGSDGESKAGQLCFTSVDIAIGGGSSYSDYSLTCGGSTPAATKYVLAGEGGPLTTWTPADAPEMMVKDGFATLAFTNVAVEANTTIEYKVVILEDGQEPVWIGDGDNNYTFYINDAGHYNLTFSYDIDGKAASCYAEYIPDLYILGQVEGNGYAWGPNIGTKMNYADGLYTLTTRVASAADGYDPGFLSFTTKLASADDWSELSNSDRWAADENDKEVADGQSYTLQQDNVGYAFKFEAGTWTITADLINKKVSIVLVSLDEQPAAKVTVTWNDRGTETPVEFNEGDALVLPANPAACANGKVFVGWTTSNAVDGSAPAVLFKEAGDKTVDTDITYYAVFATASASGSGGGTKEYSFTITKDDFNSTSYTANNNEKTSTATAADNSTMEVKWTSYQVMNSGGVIQWQKSKGYIYNSTDLGTIKSIDITSTDGTFTTYYGTAEQPSESTEVGNGYFQINVGSATGKVSEIAVTFEVGEGGGSSTSYSDYSLTCGGETPEPPVASITTDPESLSFEGTLIDDYVEMTKTFNVTGVNLNGSITAEIVESLMNLMISTSPNSLPSTGGELTVTLTAYSAGSGTVHLVLKSQDANQNEITDTVPVSFTIQQKPIAGGTVVDILKNENTINQSNTTYSTWTASDMPSGAVYSGLSAGNNTTIQLRTTNKNEGIVTTTSGGKVSSIKVTLHATTAASRTLLIYGSNTAYSATTDLFDDNKKGTEIGEVVMPSDQTENYEQTITVTDEYAFIGFRSNSGALYVQQIEITWGEGGSVDPEEVNLTPTDAQAWYYADYSTSGSHNWVMNFADGDFDEASWTFNMQIEVNTAEANALAGSYDENNGVVIGLPDETHTVLMNGLTTIEGKEVSLQLTYNSKDAAGNPTYDVVISFLGDDGKRYKINKEALAIIAKDVDSDEVIDLYGDTGTPLTKYDIVYYTCGEQYTTQSYYDGDTLLFPSIIPPAQNGKAFVGWTTTEHHTSATAPTFVEEGTAVHASANYHAVYK